MSANAELITVEIYVQQGSQPRWLSGLRRCRVHSLWLLVDHCVLRNWDRILVRAVRGLISRAGMVSICPLLWQRDVKLQQTNKQQGKTIEKQFFIYMIYGPKCFFLYIFLSIWRVYLAFQLSSHPYLCTCQIRNQSDIKELLKFNSKILKKNPHFGGGGEGSWGAHTLKPLWPTKPKLRYQIFFFFFQYYITSKRWRLYVGCARKLLIRKVNRLKNTTSQIFYFIQRQ